MSHDSAPADAGRPQQRGLANAVVLLCGTGRHDAGSKLPDIPAVGSTLTGLSEVLTERCGAREVTTKLNLPTLSELGDAIIKAARRADNILLIYYVGHGLVGDDGTLYLAARQTTSDPDRLQHTGLSYEIVRRYAIGSTARLKIVILDCCFGGRAVGPLGRETPVEDLAAIDGVFVLTSAGSEQVAIAPPGSPHTAFGGALISFLRSGDSAAGPDITLEAVYSHLDRILPASGYPRPRRRAIGSIGAFVLTDNPAYGGPPTPADRLPPPPGRLSVRALVAAVAAGTAAVPFLASARHGGSWSTLPPGVRGQVLTALWGLPLLAATAALAAAAVAGPLAGSVARLVIRRRWALLRRLRAALLGSCAFLLAMGFGSAAVDAGAGGQVWLASCPPTAHLSVLVSTESYEPARELARAFELDTAEDNFGCPAARLLVYAAAPADIHGALGKGWGEPERVRIGPRPDVWLPDWSGELRRAGAAAAAAGRKLPVRSARTVASTPVVLAVADGSAAGRESGAAATEPPPDGAEWAQLLGSMQQRDWAMVAPDPVTTVGALARVALYPPAGEAAQASPAGQPGSVKAIERYLDRSHDQGNHRLDADVAGLLCAPAGPRERTGYVVTEQAVARFNNDDPLGPACGQRGSLRLRAVYPRHTAVFDRQAVRFGWPAVNEERSRAADRFAAWFDTAAGRTALSRVGLRPPGGAAQPPLTPQWGVQPDVTPEPTQLTDDLLGAVQTRYREAHRPGRVLLAIDASESMGAPAPGDSLWRVAARGAESTVDRLGPRDEIGVWSFQGDSAAGVRKLVPLGLRAEPVQGRSRQEAIAGALAAVRPAEAAPLFDAVVGGLAEVGPTTAERVTAVVVLTDGQNDNGSTIDAKGFDDAVRNKGVRVFAVAMGATGCDAPVLKTITTATAGSCLRAQPGTVTEELKTILEAVL